MKEKTKFLITAVCRETIAVEILFKKFDELAMDLVDANLNPLAYSESVVLGRGKEALREAHKEIADHLHPEEMKANPQKFQSTIREPPHQDQDEHNWFALTKILLTPEELLTYNQRFAHNARNPEFKANEAQIAVIIYSFAVGWGIHRRKHSSRPRDFNELLGFVEDIYKKKGSVISNFMVSAGMRQVQKMFAGRH